MAKALGLSSDISFLNKFSTFLRVEKHLSASQDDIGTAIIAFSNITKSAILSLLLIEGCSDGTIPYHCLDSCLL